MSTALVPAVGGSITDLDDATAADRKLSSAFSTGTALLLVHNESDATVYVCDASDQTTSGRGIPSGATLPLGPYRKDVNLWLYGTGTGSAHYSWDTVWSEQ